MAEHEQNEEEYTEDDESLENEEDLDEVERSRMPLTAHLDELRKRLFYSILAIVILSIVAFIFIDPIFAIVQRPFQETVDITVPLNEINVLADKVELMLGDTKCQGEGESADSAESTEENAQEDANESAEDNPVEAVDKCFTEQEIKSLASMVQLSLKMLSGLIFTHPVEGFITFLKLALYTGLLVGMPFLLVQLWRFIIPALYPNEKGFFGHFLVFGSLLFYVGVVFCYLLVLPIGIGFLVGFGGDMLTPLFSIGNYISFSMLLMLVFGLSFEVPLAMFILVKMGVVQRETFFKYWKHIVVGAVVVGAVFTPPDPGTQLLMGGAVVVLYGVGLLITRFAVPKHLDEDEYEDIDDEQNENDSEKES